MEEKRQAKKVWLARTTPKRLRGRPGKMWDNVIIGNLKK